MTHLSSTDYIDAHMHYVRRSLKIKTQSQGVFVGYASTYDIDKEVDQILPKAFEKTLAWWQTKRKRGPYLYWEHDPEELIGLCLDLKEDQKGLHIKGKLFLDIPKAKEVFAIFKRSA